MAVTWKEVEEFLLDPGDRWTKAFNALNPSERVLLLSVLDAGDRPAIGEVRTVYERRIADVSDNRLTFQEAGRRLSHSFLAESTTYFGRDVVDFQHPSLR